MQTEFIEKAKKIIEEAEAVLITSGAGMGVDSGLPDFRGNEGFWKAYPVIKELGIGFSKMANPTWFTTNSALAWAFYGHRLKLYRETVPHDGFKLLLDLVKEKQENYFVVTSNVDGQFQKAGFNGEKILEVHGSIHHFQCSQNCKRKIYDAPKEEIEIDMQKFEALTIPLCPECGDIARPNILMFNDWGWNEKRTDQQDYKYRVWLAKIKKERTKLAIIEIGAGTTIPTIRNIGERLSDQLPNATLIRINLREPKVYNEKDVGLEVGGLKGIVGFVKKI